MVHASQGKTSPCSELCRSETDIVANIAHLLLGNTPVNWLELAQDYSKIRNLIEATIPGFEGFNKQIEKPGGFYLGNSAAQLQWNTPSAKANFSFNKLPNDIYPHEVSEKIDQQKHLKNMLIE